MANDLRMRLGVHNLSSDQVGAFREAYRQMMTISDNRGYNFFAGLHGAPNWFCWHHQQNATSALRMQIFLPWHRAYLYNFELAMRDRVADVTLPWWDWTLGAPRQSGLPAIFTDTRDGTKPNPLLRFRINLANSNPPVNHSTTRSPGDPSDLQGQTGPGTDNLLDQTDWSDFTDGLEDLHDFVHGWVSGDMGNIGTAAYDPIFWSHHAMIDRLWWIWQARHGNANISTDLLDVVLQPFNLRVRDVLNANDLGYDYAAAEGVIPIGGTGNG